MPQMPKAQVDEARLSSDSVCYEHIRHSLVQVDQTERAHPCCGLPWHTAFGGTRRDVCCFKRPEPHPCRPQSCMSLSREHSRMLQTTGHPSYPPKW